MRSLTVTQYFINSVIQPYMVIYIDTHTHKDNDTATIRGIHRYRDTNRHTERQTQRETETDRQTDRQTDR